MSSNARRGIPPRVQELQWRIELKAHGSPRRRLTELSRLAAHPEILAHSWRLVREGRGGPGIDGVDPRRMTRDEERRLVNDVQRELESGTYRPLPWLETRRSSVRPGGRKVRTILVPAVRDRLAQGAVRLVLEPVFETTFLDGSHGYRRGRSARTAALALLSAVRAGHRIVVRSDIADCFDSLPHDRILAALDRRVDDERLRGWIVDWMRADVVGRSGWRRLDIGVPQGGVLSPLLCNVVLHELDSAFAAREGSHLVRYADDLALACRDDGEAALGELREAVSALSLRLNATKTAIVDASRGVDFVGCHVHSVRDRSGGIAWTLRPSDAAVARLRERVAKALAAQPSRTLRVALAVVSGELRPWLAVHGTILESAQASAVEAMIRTEIAEEARRMARPLRVRVRELRWDRLRRQGLPRLAAGKGALA